MLAARHQLELYHAEEAVRLAAQHVVQHADWNAAPHQAVVRPSVAYRPGRPVCRRDELVRPGVDPPPPQQASFF